MRPSSSGPMSETVARTGWPPLPNTSQKATGVPAHFGSSSLSCSMRLCSLGFIAPGAASPERSPFTSAMKTGTPMREKLSASTWRVTVLPVPVAPAIRPWRLAMPGSRAHSVASFLAMRSGSTMAGGGC